MATDCQRMGTFVKPNDIDIKGSITLKYNSNNELVIEFSSDFLTDAGPDLDVYLSNTSGKTNSSINIHALNSLSGAQSYVVTTPGVTLTSYNYVIVHCTQYNHHYGYVMLGAQSGTDCTTLGVEENKEIFSPFFNRSNNEIVFTSLQNLDNVSISLYDIQGSKIMSWSGVTLNQGKNNLALAQLQSGLYFIHVNGNEKTTVLKFYV